MGGSLLFDTGLIQGLSSTTQDQNCIVEMWFIDFSMLVVLVSLFCKIWRAEKVCQFRKGQKILVRHVIWPFVAVILLELSFLVALTIRWPPTWEVVPIDSYAVDSISA